MANIGKITQVIGPVVDVAFDGEGAKLPNILDSLTSYKRRRHSGCAGMPAAPW